MTENKTVAAGLNFSGKEVRFWGIYRCPSVDCDVEQVEVHWREGDMYPREMNPSAKCLECGTTLVVDLDAMRDRVEWDKGAAD